MALGLGKARSALGSVRNRGASLVRGTGRAVSATGRGALSGARRVGSGVERLFHGDAWKLSQDFYNLIQTFLSRMQREEQDLRKRLQQLELERRATRREVKANHDFLDAVHKLEQTFSQESRQVSAYYKQMNEKVLPLLEQRRSVIDPKAVGELEAIKQRLQNFEQDAQRVEQIGAQLRRDAEQNAQVLLTEYGAVDKEYKLLAKQIFGLGRQYRTLVGGGSVQPDILEHVHGDALQHVYEMLGQIAGLVSQEDEEYTKFNGQVLPRAQEIARQLGADSTNFEDEIKRLITEKTALNAQIKEFNQVYRSTKQVRLPERTLTRPS